MGAVGHLRPNGQEVEEAWNAFRLLVRQGLAEPRLFWDCAWINQYAVAESRFHDLFVRWQPRTEAC